MSKPISTWEDSDFSAFEQYAMKCYESGFFNVTDKRIFVDYYLTDVISDLRRINSTALQNIQAEKQVAKLTSQFENLDLKNDSIDIEHSLEELKLALSEVKFRDSLGSTSYSKLYNLIDKAIQQRKQSREDSIFNDKFPRLPTKSKKLRQQKKD